MISRRVQALRVILTLSAWAATGWPGALLLFAAETWSGRIAGALALFVPGWLLFAMAFKPMRSTASVAGFLVLFTLSSTTLVLRAPNMEGVAGSGIRSVHASGERPSWWAPTRLVPEIDQLLFGSYLAPVGDPLIDRREAGVLRDAIRSVYRPLLKDPRFAELGSVLGDALLNRATGHFFEYVPAHAPGERLPMVLLLHGSLGNWTGYFAETVHFAEKARVIVVAPSFGFGFWNQAGGVAAIQRAFWTAVRTLPVDPSRIVLAGISNGGLGVSIAGLADGEHFRGLVYLSAVLDAGVPSLPIFEEKWKGKPILVVHGAVDPRIPEGNIGRAVAAMRDRGARVSYERVPDASHWLMFSHAPRVEAVLTAWWRQIM